MNDFFQKLFRFWEHPLVLVVLVLLILAGVYLWYRHSRRSQSIWVSESDHGQISIAPSAIQELAQHTCNDIPTIRYRRSKLIRTEDAFKLQVHILVDPEIRLADVSQYLQEQLTQGLRKNLDFSELSSIDIVVDGFRTRPIKAVPVTHELPSAGTREENSSSPS